jgi:hypothetical protein
MMNRNLPDKVAASILFSAFVAIGCWLYFGDTAIRQSRRLKLAREHLPAITNVVFAYPEYQHLQIGVTTAKGGCFLVLGAVETEIQSTKLQKLIVGTKPPVMVLYQVKVSGAER